MHRNAMLYLKEWATRTTRKPLVIRGARQVGKSYLVKLFAETEGYDLVELNFDADPSKSEYFISNDPSEIVTLLELSENRDIDREKTILFLDEVQGAPQVFSSLRYFYEKMPELKVIAAGSLLEFALESHSFSMPVGRIEYLHLGPMLFDEYLQAMGKGKLVSFVQEYRFEKSIPQGIHEQLLKEFKQYLIIGGMPEAVKVFSETGSYQECERVKSSIVETYRDDFSKYKKRVNISRLQKIFSALAGSVSEKIKYVNLSRDERAKDVEETLHLFEMAQIIYRASHSSANGVPLSAEENGKIQKLLFLDVGLLSHALGLNLLTFLEGEGSVMKHAGASCEQFVGQHLLYRNEYYIRPELHYWMREKKGSSSEVDFVIAHHNRVIPVEVKAGSTGKLRSLQVFIEEKGSTLVVRFNTDTPSRYEGATITRNKPYTFLSVPFYLITELSRLLDDEALKNR